MRFLLLLSCCGHVLLAVLSGPQSLQAFCGSLASAPLDVLSVVEVDRLAAILPEWAAMIVAMMPPLLRMPVQHVLHSNLLRRRKASLLVFSLSYFSVWSIAALVLVPVAVALQYLVGPSVLATGLVLALLWASSPVSQAARNACQNLPRIGLFGFRGYLDCARYGSRTAQDCIILCWPWMLLPMLAGRWHGIVAIIVTAALFLDRVSGPGKPVWRLPPFMSVTKALLGRQKVLGSE